MKINGTPLRNTWIERKLSSPRAGPLFTNRAVCLLCLSGPRRVATPMSPSCSKMLRDGDPLVLTYLTNPKRDWYLGITAALNRVPLVLVGEGYSWVSGIGQTQKLERSGKAIEFLRALVPGSPVVFADGLDTVIANPLTSESAKTLSSLVKRDTMMFAAECSSFPKCYIPEYAAIEAHQRCRGRSSTCFLNAGLYGGSSSALLRFLPLAGSLAKQLHGSERNEDQAASHRFMIGNALNATLGVDEQSSVFLTLRGCRGRKDKEFRVGDRRFFSCFYESHEPLQWLSRVGTSVRYAVPRGVEQHPLVAHANGFHQRLTWAVPCLEGKPCPKWTRSYTGKPIAGGGVTDLLMQKPELLRYSIMLINSRYENETCTTAPLGRVLERAREMTFAKGTLKLPKWDDDDDPAAPVV